MTTRRLDPDPIAIARQFTYLRELPPNRGLRVESVQHWSGGQFGDSWCMEFIWFVFDIAYGGQPPFERTQACEDLHALAHRLGWIVPTPAAGDIALEVNDAGHAHHVMLVTSVDPLITIAGNTNDDGSANGNGVYEIPTNPAGKVFVRIPT